MMELGDLRVALGLSLLMNLTCEEIEYEVSNQCKEWNCLNVAKGTVPAYLIRISEFRINSKYHGSKRGEI